MTLVFAALDAQETAVIDWARDCAAIAPGGALDFAWATEKRDYLGTAWYLFLMPRAIPAALSDLERRLNAGPFQAAVVAPFDAHLTVGRFEEAAPARRLAAELTASGLQIAARFSDLVVLRFDGTAERSRTHIPLSLVGMG